MAKKQPTKRTTAPPIKTTQTGVEQLKAFIKQNKKADFNTINLKDEKAVNNLLWTGLEKNKKTIRGHLGGYQRLLRIIPEDQVTRVIYKLLEAGIDSAIRITSVSKSGFMEQCLPVLGNKKEALINTIYENALIKRTEILVLYMDQMQSQEPHISAARFNKSL